MHCSARGSCTAGGTLMLLARGSTAPCPIAATSVISMVVRTSPTPDLKSVELDLGIGVHQDADDGWLHLACPKHAPAPRHTGAEGVAVGLPQLKWAFSAGVAALAVDVAESPQLTAGDGAAQADDAGVELERATAKIQGGGHGLDLTTPHGATEGAALNGALLLTLTGPATGQPFARGVAEGYS
ncbi:hypothetical protein V8C86DRAFT_2598338 [Haematococcus lacustris]